MTKKQKPDLPSKAPKRTGKRGIGPKPDDDDKKPRQARLPGTEDPEIEELENAAEDYADIRDQRQELTVEEVRLKTELLNLMHREKKTEYNHGGVNIKVIVESEKVRVRIKKDDKE